MSYTLAFSLNGATPFAVESFNFGLQNNTSVSTGAGKLTLSPLTINKTLDANSPGLFLAAASGRPYQTATLTLTKTGSTTADASYTLTEAFVVSISDSGSGHGGTFPMEQVEFLFTVIEFTSGGNMFSFDVSTGKPSYTGTTS